MATRVDIIDQTWSSKSLHSEKEYEVVEENTYRSLSDEAYPSGLSSDETSDDLFTTPSSTEVVARSSISDFSLSSTPSSSTIHQLPANQRKRRLLQGTGNNEGLNAKNTIPKNRKLATGHVIYPDMVVGDLVRAVNVESKPYTHRCAMIIPAESHTAFLEEAGKALRVLHANPHPGIATLLGAIDAKNDSDGYLLFPPLAQNLETWVTATTCIEQKLDIAEQMLLAVAHCHSLGVALQDITRKSFAWLNNSPKLVLTGLQKACFVGRGNALALEKFAQDQKLLGFTLLKLFGERSEGSCIFIPDRVRDVLRMLLLDQPDTNSDPKFNSTHALFTSCAEECKTERERMFATHKKVSARVSELDEKLQQFLYQAKKTMRSCDDQVVPDFVSSPRQKRSSLHIEEDDGTKTKSRARFSY